MAEQPREFRSIWRLLRGRVFQWDARSEGRVKAVENVLHCED